MALITQKYDDWYAKEDTPGASAIATKAAESGRTHHLCGVNAYVDKPGCTIVISDGSTEIMTISCQGAPPQSNLPNCYPFGEHAIKMTAGNAVSAIVGTGISACTICIWGYTTD